MRGRGEWRSVRPITARLCQRHRRNGTNSHIQILHGFTTRSDPQPTGRMPRPYLEHRGVLIITGYEFIEDSQLLKSWAADYMIEFRAEAYVRFNFDFYKSKTTITSVATPWTDIYKLKTARPGEWMTIAKAPTKTIRYPIRIAATSPALLLDSGRRLPCVMTLESFLGFINPKSQNISNYIR